MRRVLVLRPEPGASATVQRALKRGIDAIAVPLFRVERVAWQAPDPARFDGLLLTSANAVRHGGEQLKSLRGLKVFAVGEATAEAAREAGFDVASSGDGGVDRLLGAVDPGLRLLHLTSEDRRESAAARQAIEPVAVYRAIPIEDPDLSAATGTVALVHSPRAGRRFAQLTERRASIAIAAFSEAAAEAVGGGWESVQAAPQPNDDALLALAARLCNNPAAQ
ncbi:MAG: uroporphyrinogen-III synthase [Pseudomonadota bacterium]